MFKLVLPLFVAATLLITIFLTAQSAKAAYDVNFSNIWVGKISPGSGYIGVDIWWPTSNGGIYNPCQNSGDAYYGACVLSNSGQTSYYKVQHYTPTSTDFPYGIFIDNQDQNYCTSASWCQNPSASTVNHGWARLITNASIEVYPIYSGGQYNAAANSVGGVRVQVSFPNFANGGRYSNNIGNITLPQLGQPNVGKLNGFVTYDGAPVSNNRLLLEAFQEQSTLSSSTEYPVTGFAVTNSNSDGYYNLGAVPSGTYKIYITDTQTNHQIILSDVNISTTYERLDFQLQDSCFGHTGSTCIDPSN